MHLISFLVCTVTFYRDMIGLWPAMVRRELLKLQVTFYGVPVLVLVLVLALAHITTLVSSPMDHLDTL